MRCGVILIVRFSFRLFLHHQCQRHLPLALLNAIVYVCSIMYGGGDFLHLRSRLCPEGQGCAPCPTRKLSTSGWLCLSQIECSAPANREAATSRPRTDRPMRRRVAAKGGLSRLSTNRRGGLDEGEGETVCSWQQHSRVRRIVCETSLVGEGVLVQAV